MLTRSRRVIVITARQTTAPARSHRSHPSYVTAEASDPGSALLRHVFTTLLPSFVHAAYCGDIPHIKKQPFTIDRVSSGFLDAP